MRVYNKVSYGISIAPGDVLVQNSFWVASGLLGGARRSVDVTRTGACRDRQHGALEQQYFVLSCKPRTLVCLIVKRHNNLVKCQNRGTGVGTDHTKHARSIARGGTLSTPLFFFNGMKAITGSIAGSRRIVTICEVTDLSRYAVHRSISVAQSLSGTMSH